MTFSLGSFVSILVRGDRDRVRDVAAALATGATPTGAAINQLGGSICVSGDLTLAAV